MRMQVPALFRVHKARRPKSPRAIILRRREVVVVEVRLMEMRLQC